MSSSLSGHPGSRPTAVAVEVGRDRLRVTLSDERELTVPIAWFDWLAGATEAQRSDYLLIEGGGGIWWEQLEESISIAGLLGVPEFA
jgi:hypothetical protein